MRLLVSGATATLRRHPDSPYLGTLVVPAARNRLDPVLASGLPWAADNAAFTGFDPAAFCRMLRRIAHRPGCRFVALPDVVGDAASTFALFAAWEPVVRVLGLPAAQDGLVPAAVPWDRLAALFGGGGTDWELGPEAAAVVREAKRRGLWVHLGRCNTKRRFRHAYQLGCDSVDGSGLSRWPDQQVPLALRWPRDLHGDADAPAEAGGAFFRGGLGGTLFDRPGWAVVRVEGGPAGYMVHARFTAEPTSWPGCGRVAPDGTRLYRHGAKVTRVRDEPRHARPVLVALTRGRFRCGARGRTFAPPADGVGPGARLTDAALGLIAGGWADAPAAWAARHVGATAGRSGGSANGLLRRSDLSNAARPGHEAVALCHPWAGKARPSGSRSGWVDLGGCGSQLP